jgi:hypothetical protein
LDGNGVLSVSKGFTNGRVDLRNGLVAHGVATDGNAVAVDHESITGPTTSGFENVGVA